MDDENIALYFRDHISDPPRRVAVRGKSLLGLPLLLFGLGFTFYWLFGSIQHTVHAIHLKNRGIDSFAISEGLGERKIRGGYSYFAIYTYDYAGRNYRREETIDYLYYREITSGNINILIDPENPSDAAINTKGQARYPKIASNIFGDFFIPIGFALVFIGFSIGLFKSYSRDRFLLTRGTATRGSIVTKEEYQTRNGKRWRLTYAFPTQQDGVFYGARSDIPLESPEIVLEKPIIFYDPLNPECNALYPLHSVKLCGK